MKRLFLSIFIIIFFFFISAQCFSQPKIDSSPEMQAKRKVFIQKLFNQNIIYKIEVPTENPRVYVAAGFYSLPFDAKQNFMSVILAFYLAQKAGTQFLVLRDWRNNKDIGTFDLSGLHLK